MNTVKKLIKKFLVSSFAVASMFLFSNVAFAQNYLLKVAFVGDSSLKNDIVRKIFYNSNTSTSDFDLGITWGVHVQDEDTTFLYRFKNVDLDINDLNNENGEIITECDIVFIVVDFLNFNARDIDKYIIKIRSMFEQGKYAKVMIVGKNVNDEALKILDSIKFMYARSKGMDFLTIVDNENFREKFFEMVETNNRQSEFSVLLVNRQTSIPMNVCSFLQMNNIQYCVNKHDAELAKHKIKINDLVQENVELKEEIERLRHDFSIELRNLGNESWRIVRTMADMFSKEGHIDKRGCEKVIDEINDISRRYGEFRNDFIDLRTYVNNIVRTHTGEINCFKNDVRREIQEYGESMANFTNETTRRVDRLSQRLDDDENNLQERINKTNISLDETRNRLDRKEREFNTCISNLHERIDRVDGETSDRLNRLARTLENYRPVLEGVAELQGSYEEFRNDFDRKISNLPLKIKKDILKTLEEGHRNSSWFGRLFGKSEVKKITVALQEDINKAEEEEKKEEEKKKEKDKDKDKE